MTNDELMARFETGDLAAESFHHYHHVQLAFAYLSNLAVLPALQGFTDALKRYASVRGTSVLYHETITFAYFFLIRERMARAPGLDWDTFVEANSDLLQWKPGILDRYYRGSTLQVDLARAVFLFPDKIAEL